MLTIRGEQGQLRACCEFWVVNQDGTRNPHGLYVWVHQLELSQGEDFETIWNLLCGMIAEECPTALAAYWQREKTASRPHLFTRNRLLKEVKV